MPPLFPFEAEFSPILSFKTFLFAWPPQSVSYFSPGGSLPCMQAHCNLEKTCVSRLYSYCSQELQETVLDLLAISTYLHAKKKQVPKKDPPHSLMPNPLQCLPRRGKLFIFLNPCLECLLSEIFGHFCVVIN